jgi:predicted ATPase/DNA-binding CsgD family transcriptional regulator
MRRERHDQGGGNQRLPAPVSPIVGRDRQIDQALSLLDRGVRLLTIAGPGGIGKTRLALEVAHRVAERQPDGVVFIELDAESNPGLAPVAIARAVGVPEQAGDIEALLGEWLRDDDRLLILDNFEQVLEAAPFLSRLLSACPSLSIMVTSRIAPLHLEGERVLPVGPLEFPAEGEAGDANLLDYPAVSYFLQHAPAVDVTASAEAVKRICQRLDGIPLALELAAARVGLLTVEEIAEQTTGWMPLLVSGRRDAPERHRTMDATIRWSYELLDDELRAVFRKLSVFTGGFTRDAAQAVASASAGELTVLIESRLIEPASAASGQPRFRLLEPVRDFGVQAATEGGELERARTAHAAWARTVAHEVSPNLFGSRLYSPDGIALEEMLEPERGNLTSAIAWLLESGDVTGAMHVAGVLSDFWYRRTYPLEGLKWIGEALQQARRTGADAGPEFVKACMGIAILGEAVGDFDSCEHYGNLGLAAAREIEDRRATGESLAVLGYVALNREQFERAIELSEQALEIFEQPEFEDLAWQADLHENLALAAMHLGDLEKAAFHAEQGLALARQIDDPWSISAALFTIGDVRCHQHRFLEALDIFEEGVDIAFRRRDRTASVLWRQMTNGMAGCATVARLAFPHQPELALPMIQLTEVLCRQIGLATLSNRIAYTRIRDDYLRQGLLDMPLTAESQPGPSLPAALRETRESFARLRQLIEQHGSGELPAGVTRPVPGDARLPVAPLTRKQLETVKHIVAGKTVKEIAVIDGVGESTVYERLERIRERWELQTHATMAEIAVFAIRNGIA